MGGSAAGFPEGTLMSVAKNGTGGNQYIKSASVHSLPILLLFQELHILIIMVAALIY